MYSLALRELFHLRSRCLFSASRSASSLVLHRLLVRLRVASPQAAQRAFVLRSADTSSLCRRPDTLVSSSLLLSVALSWVIDVQCVRDPLRLRLATRFRDHFDVAVLLLLEDRSEEHTSELQSLRHLVC